MWCVCVNSAASFKNVKKCTFFTSPWLTQILDVPGEKTMLKVRLKYGERVSHISLMLPVRVFIFMVFIFSLFFLQRAV